jgi:hypothetical protein
MSSRYFFNLTDGEDVIRDEDGIVVPDLHAALVEAMKAIEELRAEDPSAMAEWQGWWLEIIDHSGQTVQSIPLDRPLWKLPSQH